MRPVLIALTLLAATTAFAQTPKTEQEARAQLELIERNACPVGITARQQGSPAAIWTTSLEDQHKSTDELKTLHSGVHVDLNAQHKEIKQAELTVFFLPPGTRAQPLMDPSSAPRAEIHKNFSLTAGKTASRHLDGDLLLGAVASVTHISLMSVTYSDGSEWHAHNSTSCSIKPRLYMPVQVK
jgi:hypothetical protein